jgi:hypothetical protein
MTMTDKFTANEPQETQPSGNAQGRSLEATSDQSSSGGSPRQSVLSQSVSVMPPMESLLETMETLFERYLAQPSGSQAYLVVTPWHLYSNGAFGGPPQEKAQVAPTQTTSCSPSSEPQ